MVMVVIAATMRDKMRGGELGRGPRMAALHDRIDGRLAHYAAHPPEPRAATDADTQMLAGLLRTTLEEVWR